MSLTSQQIEALFNGVSQQPATLRLPSQCEAQINGYAKVADGLRKRPPLEHVAKVTTDDLSTAHIHTINRDVTERHIVVVTDGDIKVYDAVTGAAETVNFPNGKTYLSITGGGNASESFALVSVADYTFVVNKSVATALANVGDDLTIPPNYSTYHRVGNSGTTGLDSSAETALDQAIAYNPSGAYRGVKQTFSDLPADSDNPVEGDVWKVAGYDQNGFGAYYVRRTGGVWEECVKPALQNRFDETTMPHALVRESDGTFTFTHFAWNVRQVGDDTSNPPPTFTSRTINDVFFYKNRLAFVADENVIFSGAGDFGNFWRTTVTDVLDSDLVDVAVSSTKVSLLKYAVPFNNELMLFADQTQFRLNVDQLLTPKTVSIDTVTEYQMGLRPRPVGIGTDIYFTTESGEHTRVREYFVSDNNAETTDAADITAHVPKYLPKDVFKLAGSTNEDVLFAVSDAAGYENRIYTYNFYWDGNKKVQSAWSYWEHGDSYSQVLSIEVLQNELYVLINRADGVYLEKCNVQSGQVTGNLSFQVLLDRMTDLTGIYFSSGDYTEFTLPYPVTGHHQWVGDYKIVRGADFAGENGSLIDPAQYTWVDTTTIQVPGDETDGVCHCGLTYTFSYKFSEQFFKVQNRAITTGTLQLRTWTLYFTDTGFFQTYVDPYGIDDPSIESIVPSGLADYTGMTLGAASLITGEPSFETGQYSFMVMANNRQAVIQLINDTHVQANFQSAEWEGEYFNRAGVR